MPWGKDRPKLTGERAKQHVRTWIVEEMKVVEPDLVLDLWGGGESARQMADAGLNVLSVDDGRWAHDPAGMQADAMQHGYRATTGHASEFVGMADAAWLDFCGHWSPEVSKTLKSCRHMKVLFVTLMPERTPVGFRLSQDEWKIILKALLANATSMRVTGYKYKRESGLYAWVFKCQPAIKNKNQLKRQRQRWHENPEFREKWGKVNKENRRSHIEASRAQERMRALSQRS